MSRPALEVISVHKQFGQIAAVRDVSLAIPQGEFFSLLGPSGCGKTTLLRMIAGFEEPTSGRILVAGADMTAVRPHRRPVNMVFQSYALFPHMSVFDNVAFGLRQSRSLAKSELPARVREALALVKLENFADRLPRQLSGGQQQRVALARAVVNRPSVLLLDEPLSALDLKIRQEMQEELARLKRELGITFVMVTHDQGEALALSSRIAVFFQGNLEQVGTPEEIFERPATPFVAEFIGDTNILKATVESVEGDFVVVRHHGGARLVAARPEGSQWLPGQKVVVWARMQAVGLDLCPGEPEQACPAGARINRFQAVVTGRSYQGTTTEFRLETAEGLSLRAESAVLAAAAPAVGQTVGLSLAASSLALIPDGPRQER